MTTHPDDHPVLGFGAPAGEAAPRAGRRSADPNGTLRPRRLPAPEWGRHPPHRDGQRYYLCSEEPSGEFVEIIIPVTDAGHIRYFTTRDGDRLTEVDEDYFVHRREGNARSLLELDAREMAELQAELDFVRPVLGRDPLAEAADATAGADAADAETADAEAADADEDDEDQAIEEHHPVIGSNRLEHAEPEATAVPATAPRVASIAPVAPAPVPPVPPVSPVAPVAPVASVAPEPEQAVDAAAQVALAKGIAFVAHHGQLDQVGAEYIDHPGRVAERFDALTEPVLVAAAWLHDVLEDSDVTAQDLLEAGVQPEVVEIVQLLTRDPDVADDAYYAGIRRHPVARRVKLADIDDNTAPWRVRRLDYAAQVRLTEKYRRAREALTST
ncbi:hypothetical protein [Agromyces laixinhei]|uniref:hypothetical protein n=1 Tax=Agromyces laixinhei TaxID=2585717 RepID=UPI001E6412BE|nr:hypothetical protein [Agromyces laixinhei]